jgi:hypothetical protein
LANEFGPENLGKHYNVQTPQFAAIRITKEEAVKNCLSAGRYIVVEFERIDSPSPGIFIVFSVSTSWVWEWRNAMIGQNSMEEVVKDLRTGAACC